MRDYLDDGGLSWKISDVPFFRVPRRTESVMFILPGKTATVDDLLHGLRNIYAEKLYAEKQ